MAGLEVLVLIQKHACPIYLRRSCDFTQMFAATGSKRLPRVLQTARVFDMWKLTASENGIIRLPRVQFGSNGLPRVQRGCDAWCHGHTGRPHRAVHSWTGLT